MILDDEETARFERCTPVPVAPWWQQRLQAAHAGVDLMRKAMVEGKSEGDALAFCHAVRDLKELRRQLPKLSVVQ